MKLDLFAWDEVECGKWLPAPSGALQLRASTMVALYVMAEGFETLAGYGAEFDIEAAQGFEFKVDAPKSVRAFVLAPVADGVGSTGEVFTRADRELHQSGTVYEVRKALREQQLAQRQMMREMRQATAALRVARAASVQPAPAVPAPAPAAVEDPPNEA